MVEKQKPNDKIRAADMAAAIIQAQGIKAAAARILGVNWNTVDRYIKEYATCRAAFDQAVHQVTDIARGNVVSTIMSGNSDDKLATSKWWLKAKDDEFKDKSTVVLTDPEGGVLKTEIIVSTEAAKAVTKAIQEGEGT